MRYATWALVGLLMLSGCSSLIVRDQDSAGTVTGKVLTRMLLCPLTLCLTEAGIAGRKFEEARGSYAGYDAETYAAYGLMQNGMALNNAANFRSRPSPVPFQPPGDVMRNSTQFYNFPNGQRMTCQNVGMMTNCY